MKIAAIFAVKEKRYKNDADENEKNAFVGGTSLPQ